MSDDKDMDDIEVVDSEILDGSEDGGRAGPSKTPPKKSLPTSLPKQPPRKKAKTEKVDPNEARSRDAEALLASAPMPTRGELLALKNVSN
jgi:hypothetical protein